MPSSGDEGESSARSGGAPSEIPPEHRTQWNKLNKHNKSIKAGQLRLSDLATATNLSEKIKELPQHDLKPIHSRRFQLINNKVDEAVANADTHNSAYVSTLIEQDASILTNKLYIFDQKHFREAIAHLEGEVDKYIELLESTEGLEAAALPSTADPSLITILDAYQKSAQLGVENQVALTEALDKLGDASSVLKPSQPHFTPQGNLEDYLRYKDWRRQFNLFIKRVPDAKWDEKSEWLKSSVKSKAYLLIASCPNTQAGYEAAFVLLDTRYQQTDYIREAMFEFIHTFKIQAASKNFSNVADQLVTLGN